MKLIASFFCLTLAAAQLLGCQKGTSFDPTSAGTFFPLRPGSTWTYRIVDEKLKTTQVFTDRAARQSPIDSSKRTDNVVTESSGTDGLSNLTIHYAVENGYVTRVFGFGDGSQILFEEREFLPHLLKPGLTWTNSVFPFGGLAEGFHLTQTHHTSLENSVVEVPAGHFTNCIRIQTDTVYRPNSSKKFSTRRLRYVDWYAPNVGLIKTQVVESGLFGSEIARVELLSFEKSQIKTVSR